MAAFISENTQFFGTDGLPLVNGKIFIGVNGSDPVAVPTNIFSNRALTSALANPQTLDALGKSTNKIWIPDQYSYQINDSDDVMVFQDLDAGILSSVGVSGISNVLGTNAITGEASPTISALTDRQQFTFKVANTNTAAITLNIDGQGAKAVVRNVAQPIVSGQFVANQIVIVQYNSTDDTFHWISENTKVHYDLPGADIASAATVDLLTATGNSPTITGTTDITALGTVPAGAIFNLKFSGNLKVSHNGVSLILQNAEDIFMNPGNTLTVLSLGSGNWLELARSREGGLEQTGSMKATFRSTAPPGWLLLNGDSIAKTSGGTLNNLKFRELFIFLWDNLADAQAAVSGGRGGSAQADFDANKNLTMPDGEGNVLVGLDSGTFATMGDNGGVETVTLAESQMPAHTHTDGVLDTLNTSGATQAAGGSGGSAGTLTTDSTGGGGSHTNLQPWLVANHIIKY